MGSEVWIYEGVLEKLREILNGILKGGHFPKDQQTAVMTPVYKKRKTLMDTGYKILASILDAIFMMKTLIRDSLLRDNLRDNGGICPIRGHEGDMDRMYG